MLPHINHLFSIWDVIFTFQGKKIVFSILFIIIKRIIFVRLPLFFRRLLNSLALRDLQISKRIEEDKPTTPKTPILYFFIA